MSRIARNLFFWTILIGLFGSFMLSYWQFKVEYNRRISERHTELLNIGELFVPALTQSLWTIDTAQLRLQVQGIAQLSVVDAVDLHFQNGSLHAPDPDADHIPTDDTNDAIVVHYFELNHRDGEEVYKLGDLHVASDLSEARADVFRANTLVFASTFFVVTLISLGVALLYHFQVTQRLLRIGERTRSITPDDLRKESYRVSQPDTPQRRDELDELAASIDVLCDAGHRALTELDAGEERFALLMKSSHDGLWDWDLRTDAVYYSPRWMQMLGYEPDELAGDLTSWSNLVDPDARQSVLDAVERYLNGDEPKFEAEFRMRHKNGSWLHILARATAAYEDGEPVRLIGTHLDITAMKNAQQDLLRSRQELEDRVIERTRELEASQQRYQQLVEGLVGHILFTVVVSGEDQILTYVSPSVKNVLGYNPEDIVGKPTSQSLQHRPGTTGTIFGGLQSTEVDFRFPYLQEIVDAHGRPRLLELTSRPTYGQDGELIALEGIAHDVTDRQQREADLIKAQADAQRANATKSAFLASMSHEIRTPMNGVIGMLDVLGVSELSEKDAEAVETIRFSANSLLAIIDDILDISKIEAGKLELSTESLSIEEEVDGLFQLLDRIALSKNVSLTLFCDPQIPSHLIFDATRLRQILTNLAGNAIKFSSNLDRQGQVYIRVVLDRQDGENAWIRFEVQDNGIGIEHDALERLFSPFEQADSSTTRSYGGTGLGLVISQNLAGLMGGKIKVQSEPGRGSTFSCRLRFQVAKDRAPLLATGLSGTHAMVLSSDPQREQDLVVFLEKAGAKVHQSAPPAQTITGGPLCIVAVDTQAFGAAKQIAEGPLQDKAVILRISHRRSGLIQRTADNVTCVDHALLTRRRFLTAVAVASGKLPPEVDALPGSAQNDDVLPFVEDGKDVRSPEVGTSGRGKILVAEDNEINQIVIDRQLTTLGYSADMANDGVEAFDKWMAGEYELILTDLHMPRMDGYDLAAKIRRVEEQTDRARVRIVALTANAIKGEAERCLETGMDDYLSKPITLEHLKEALLAATKQQV